MQNEYLPATVYHVRFSRSTKDSRSIKMEKISKHFWYPAGTIKHTDLSGSSKLKSQVKH